MAPRQPALGAWARWVPNYGSVEEHAEFARAKFEEDIAEGMMIKMLMSWLADRLEGGARLQQGAMFLVFYTDAKAENGRAWIGGFRAARGLGSR